MGNFFKIVSGMFLPIENACNKNAVLPSKLISMHFSISLHSHSFQALRLNCPGNGERESRILLLTINWKRSALTSSSFSPSIPLKKLPPYGGMPLSSYASHACALSRNAMEKGS